MTIFITIGTQAPFDRLIKAVDEFAPELCGASIIAQTSKANYYPKNFKSFEWLAPTEFDYFFNKADLIISHAGMGTIISALECKKPIIILPRRAQLKEHRNDHQLATAKKLEQLNYVHVVYRETEIRSKVLEVIQGSMKPLYTLGKFASKELLNSINEFLQKERSVPQYK